MNSDLSASVPTEGRKAVAFGVFLALILVVGGAAVAYQDYRRDKRCEAAGGVPVGVKCVRPGSFIEVPR